MADTWYVRLFADIKLFMEQLDQTKFDRNIHICALLRCKTIINGVVTKSREDASYLNDLLCLCHDCDSQIFTWLGWVWRNLDRFEFDDIRVLS